MAKEPAPIRATGRRPRVRTTLSWHKAPAESLRSFIGLCTDNGYAVLMGRTMDGGALMLQVLAGTERYKDYITSYADIIPALQQMLEDSDGPATADLLTVEAP